MMTFPNRDTFEEASLLHTGTAVSPDAPTQVFWERVKTIIITAAPIRPVRGVFLPSACWDTLKHPR